MYPHKYTVHVLEARPWLLTPAPIYNAAQDVEVQVCKDQCRNLNLQHATLHRGVVVGRNLKIQETGT